jgi:hypothetical protein
MNFGNTLTLPTEGIVLHGSGPITLRNVVGLSPLVKIESGTTTWTPTAPENCNVTISDGTLVMGADGSTDVFTGAISVMGTAF